MRFFEYEARELVRRAGIPVTDYGFTTDAEEAGEIAARIGGPTVIKSQVLSGGRMKAGGVKFADTPEEAVAHAREILVLEINGHMPRGVLVDPRAEVEQEYYAGVVWDGTRKQPVIIFSPVGGIDIEQVAEEQPEKVGRRHFSNILPFSEFIAKEAIASSGVTGPALNKLVPIVSRLARMFVENDMVLAEINPLGRLADGSFVALDAHMDMENEARPRHEKLLGELGVGKEETRQAREPTPFELAGEQIDSSDHRGVAGNVTEFDGNLGLVIGAGGGSLTLFDAVRAHGGRPANYCEIGGNPSVAKACGLTKLVLSKPGVDKIAVMMSIVSNTRVDIVARGVIKACLELDHDPAEKIAIFRIPGAWEEEGFKILERYGVEYADRSVSLNEAARRAVEKIQGAGAAARPPERGSGLMSILIDADTTFIVQGITGREAVNLTRECLDYGAGAKIVGGVTPGAPGARGARGPGVRHRGPGGRAPRGPDRRLGRDRPPRLHPRRGVRGAGERHQADRDRDRADPAPRRGGDGGARRPARGADHRAQLPRDHRPRRDQDGRHRRPRQERRPGLHARADRRDLPLGRDDHGDVLDPVGGRPRPVGGRVDRRRRHHRLHLRGADAAVRGRPPDPGDRHLHRARRADGGRAGRLDARPRGVRAPADRGLHGRAASWTRCRG